MYGAVAAVSLEITCQIRICCQCIDGFLLQKEKRFLVGSDGATPIAENNHKKQNTRTEKKKKANCQRHLQANGTSIERIDEWRMSKSLMMTKK